MWVILRNNADWDCFKTPILREILRTRILFMWNVVHFWKCKKPTSVSHSSTESEIMSLDSGLRWDGFSHVIYGIWLFFVLGNTTQNHDLTEKPVVCRDASHAQGQQSRGMFNVLNNVDSVPSNVHFSHQEALLFVFEDNEAVIKMIIKGRSPTMRHVSRTTELPLIGYLIESIWTPKSKSSTLTPKTNSQTCSTREISHVTNGIIFCVC